ncbi:MAG: hypothetical protein AAF696_27570 [Bacteroidota bacterium]
MAQKEDFCFIPADQWKAVWEIAKKEMGEGAYLIAEGASSEAALAGAASLMLDILRNEKEEKLAFEHIFVDAGTGMSAIALILAHASLKHHSQIHVVTMAGDEAYFLAELNKYQLIWQKLFDETLSKIPQPHLYFPLSAKSFGSINRQLLGFIQKMAKKEGLLLDPVYNAKLFQKAFDLIEKNQLKGDICILHSGGGSGLMGFAERLE